MSWGWFLAGSITVVGVATWIGHLALDRYEERRRERFARDYAWRHRDNLR